ncbi:MAG: hypothetical protein JNK14_15265 [Chitinophagaceae bacterium]|nr:hypothetical protein [Chitinophagaceae bacterium]
MKRQVRAGITAVLMLYSMISIAQEKKMNTLFDRKLRYSGGYGTLTNKLTTIRGDFANISGIYGGWFINHQFMIGLGAAASTNNIKVPLQYSTDPSQNRTYQYGQFGLMTEYVIASHKTFHVVLQAFGGAGFTMQYQRHRWPSNPVIDDVTDENWFVVAEPGVQLEMNVFKWMRFSPGVSYRAAFGSDAAGLKDKDLSAVSYNATLKFGRF